jgi:glycosyltransferase involved in cell wall biosynthesis
MKSILIIAGFKDSLVNFRGDMIADLVKSGFRVHVAAPGLEAEDQTRKTLVGLGAETHGVAIDRTGVNPLKDVVSIISLWRLIRKISPDILFAYTIKPVIYGLLVGRCLSVPSRVALITGLGNALGGSGLKQSLLIWMHRLSFKGVLLAFFQNADDHRFFKSSKIVTQDSNCVLVNGSGVNLKSFPFSKAPTETITFFMAARLLKAKGVGEFAEAASKITQKYKNARFVLAGSHENGNAFVSSEELQGWGASGAISYLGSLPDVRPSLAGSSVFVLPSYYPEGVPRSILEALATGRAIITTDTPGCKETVKQGVNGFLIEPKSTAALTAACEKILDEPELVSKMGMASRTLAEELFDVQKVNDRILREIAALE